jgi:hypothetical protein
MPDETQKAKDIIEVARKAAEDLASKKSDDITNNIADALRIVFGEKEDAQRFIDVTRIPLLCKSVIEIHTNIAWLKLALLGLYALLGSGIVAIVVILLK